MTMPRSLLANHRRSFWQWLVSGTTGRSADTPGVGIGRPAGSAEEARVAEILAGLTIPTRAALVAALADDLRLAAEGPWCTFPEVGIWRLAIYQDAAEELIGALMGDFLVETPGA